MSKKKPDEQIKRRLVSKAPPPPPRIKGGTGYPEIRSKRPDWTLWNKMAALSINECVFLLINVEPNTYLDHSKQKQYDRLIRLVRSYEAAGGLPSYGDIAPREFVQLAVSIDETPPENWKPIGGRKAKAKPAILETSTDPSGTIEPAEEQVIIQKPKNGPDVDELREAAVQLCMKKVRGGVGTKYIKVVDISVELYKNGLFKNGEAFSTKWRTSETIRSYLKPPHNPMSDERFKNAKPDKKSSFNEPPIA